MFKKTICLALALVLILVVGTSLAEEISASPRYTYTSSVDGSLSISSGIATVAGSITPWGGRETLVHVRLQQQINGVWKTIQTWTGHQDAGSSSAGGTKSVDSGYYYRTHVTGYVYDSNGTLLESVSMSTTPKAYGTVTP